ncbi:hypothetical protein D3C80_2187240 [compost metagenome]
MLEQLLGADGNAGLTRPADHLQGDDGVATQLEEVVGHTHLLALEHVLPDTRQRLLH